MRSDIGGVRFASGGNHAGSTSPRLLTRLLDSPATFHFRKKERVPRFTVRKYATQICIAARRKRGSVSHTDAQAAPVPCPLWGLVFDEEALVYGAFHRSPIIVCLFSTE
jgi:hypothetical protein